MLLAGLALGPAATAAVSTDIFVEPTTPGSGDSFGSSLAIGNSFFVSGAPTDDDVASNAGSATVYFADPSTGLPSFATLEAPMGLSAGANFGNVVAADEDTFTCLLATVVKGRRQILKSLRTRGEIVVDLS